MNKDKIQLSKENMGLVHACAKRFKDKGIEYDDLFQAGCEGLVKAINRFDIERGVKFSTYAIPVILGEIKKLFREGGSVKVSRTLKELSLAATRESNKFTIKNQRPPTINELSEILGVDVHQIVMALNALILPLSLSGTNKDDGEEAKEIDIPVEECDILAEKIALKESLLNLKDKDRSIIILRFFKDFTQSKTAKLLGMSQVQISRKEKKILSELRQKLI